MKKQEEIFHEIQDMMGETKEGRIRWSVEVQTTEANPVEEKPVEHEDGLDWTIDECYVSYYCRYKGKDFCLITYEMLKTANRSTGEQKVKSSNMVFLPPLGMRFFDIHALLPYSIEVSNVLLDAIHRLWVMLLDMYKVDKGRYEAEDSITKSYLNALDDVNRLYCMDIVKADRTGNKYYIVMFNTSRSFPDIYVAHTKDGELITDTEVEYGFADFNTYRITRKFGKYHMYWKAGDEWFTMRIDKKYEKGFAVRHITEYIAAGLLGIYFFIFIKSSNKARKEKEEEKQYGIFGRYRCTEVSHLNEIYEDFAKHLTENVADTEIIIMPDSFEIFGNRYDNVKYEFLDSKKHYEIPEIKGKKTEIKIVCGDEIFYYVKTAKEILFVNTLNGNVLLLIKALQEEKSYGS